MNSIMTSNIANQTMSSLEIAELVNSRHDKVKQSIERLVDRSIITQPPMGDESYKDGSGRTVTMRVYYVGKRESLICVAQLCPEFTARIVDRWQELEERAAKPALDPMQVLNDPSAMRGLLLGYAEKVLTLEHEVGEMKPKVRALDWLATASEGSTCLRVSAKLMQMPERKFIQFAHAESFIFRAHGSGIWQGYADKIKAGLVEQKYQTILLSDGTEKTIEQVLITRAGLAKLAEIRARKMQSALMHHHPIPSTRLKDHPLSKIRKELEMA